VNKHLIDAARAVIVHSDYAKQMVKGIRPDVDVINIPLHTPDIVNDYDRYKLQCRERLGIGQSDVVMGAFGFATTAKRIPQIVEAFHLFCESSPKTDHNVFLYIVGKLEDKRVTKMIKQYGLEHFVIVTGFVSLDEFKVYMGACDFCFNLRYPTQGESSANLHRMFGMGKPVIITKIAAFEQYPDEIAIKVSYGESEVDEIYRSICLLTGDIRERHSREEAAWQYAVEYCSLEGNVNRYIGFFNDLSAGRFQEDYLDSLIDRLMYLGLDSEEYILHLANQLDTKDYAVAT
jgi:glycosyltransferase involved in cell wall biosynthesis